MGWDPTVQILQEQGVLLDINLGLKCFFSPSQAVFFSCGSSSESISVLTQNWHVLSRASLRLVHHQKGHLVSVGAS